MPFWLSSCVNCLEENKADHNDHNYNGEQKYNPSETVKGYPIASQGSFYTNTCEFISLNVPGAHLDNLVTWRPIDFWTYNFLGKCFRALQKICGFLGDMGVLGR
jgi:hypothetical protein